jgi:glycosyltransferase involved in cell wall biosynthesis
MSSRLPRVSVVICSHNGAANLSETLRALARNARTFQAFEVVLVDSTSTEDLLGAPGSREAVESLEQFGIGWLLTRAASGGLTAARVHGARTARADVVCFLDDDNEILDEYLERGLLYFDDARLGVLVSRVSPRFAVRPPPAVERRQHLLALNAALGDEKIVWEPSEAWCPTIGAGLWVRKAMLLVIYDAERPRAVLPDRTESQLTSGGDIEIGIWAGRLGYRRAYAPDARLNHHIPAGRLACPYFTRLIMGVVRSQATIIQMYQLRDVPPRWIRWLRLPGFVVAALAAAVTRRDSLREFIFILTAELAECLGRYRIEGARSSDRVLRRRP